MFCTDCGAANEDHAAHCAQCGAELRTGPPAPPPPGVALTYCTRCGASHGPAATHCSKCGAVLMRPSQASSSPFTSWIPASNPPALAAYYLGLFSLMPCFGLLLSIPAIVCGIIGLQRVRQDPAVKGGNHAWAGLALGVLSAAGQLAFMGLIVFA